MTGISNGARTTGGTNYVTLDGGIATFANSSVLLSNGNRTITVTIVAPCTDTGCATLGQQTTSVTYSFIAATTLADPAGNFAATAAKTQSIRLF
jgi:hypothetical protein